MGKHTKANSKLIQNSDEKQRPKWLKYLKGVHTRRVLLARVRQLIYHWGCGKERQHLTCTRALPDDRENRLVHYCCCCSFWPFLFPFLFHWPLLLTLWGGWVVWLFCHSVSRSVGCLFGVSCRWELHCGYLVFTIVWLMWRVVAVFFLFCASKTINKKWAYSIKEHNFNAKIWPTNDSNANDVIAHCSTTKWQ